MDVIAPREAVTFIESRTRGKALFIHCALGYSRSVGVLLAYLIKQGESLEAVLRQLRTKRTGIVVPTEMRQALRRYEYQWNRRRSVQC